MQGSQWIELPLVAEVVEVQISTASESNQTVANITAEPIQSEEEQKWLKLPRITTGYQQDRHKLLAIEGDVFDYDERKCYAVVLCQEKLVTAGECAFKEKKVKFLQDVLGDEFEEYLKAFQDSNSKPKPSDYGQWYPEQMLSFANS